MINNEDDFDPFAGGEVSRTAPLTPEQEEIWLSIQFGGLEANLAYNEALAITLRGGLDRPALRRALDGLIQRHEALRATLSGDGASLCILSSTAMPLEEQNLEELPPEARQTAVDRARREAVMAPFDLVKGPLVRAQLLRLSDREHVLVLTAHHIICDGWSGAVLAEELGKLYSSEASGKPSGLGPAPQLCDYAGAMRQEASSPEARTALSYWLAKYRDRPAPLELPIDFARPAERRFDADRVDYALPQDLVRRLKSTGAHHGASFVATLVAAFQVFLHRLSGQRTVAMAMPAAGQSITGQHELVGHCVRTLPLRAELDPEQAFGEHLKRARGALLDDLEHSQLTFGSLIKHLALPRDPSRLPLVSVMMNVDPDVSLPVFDGLEVKVETVPRAYDNFELFLNATVAGDDVVLETTYSTQLFERSTIERRLEEFRTLLESIVRDPTTPLGDLELMPAREKQWILHELNQTEAAVPPGTICAAVLAACRKEPERPAVTSKGRTLSYGELGQASAALASELGAAGIGPGQRVGVCLSRSVDLLVALLGILRAGAAYVPLDPEYPAERLALVAGDAGLSACVTEPGLSDRIAGDTRRFFVTGSGAGDPNLDRSEMAEPAYVIYTSGSTGRPKGVVVEHRNVRNFLASMAKAPGIERDAVLLAVTTPSFDISVLELFLPLTVGAHVVIAAEEDITDGRRLGELIATSGATVMQATPAGWRVLLEAGWEGKPDLKALTGGEALPAPLAEELVRRTASVWNCYGPTETTVWSTVEKVEGGAITIGRPIDNTRVYVLDARLQPVAPGATGELYIGGAGVTRGYWNRPELTEERFVADPFVSGGRMYNTGDLARIRFDGRLEWLGRSDFQVKVRGHRIELGEIEARLGECAGVREAVVIVREDRPGDQRIVAYVRLTPTAKPAEEQLRDELRRTLPTYMLPQHIVFVSAFPLTPNGKVDRKALPAPQAGASAGHREPETDVARQLAKEMGQLLGVTRVGLDDDFFMLGGHSLLALRLAARVRDLWSVDMPMRVVFGAPTLERLAEFVEAGLMVRGGGRAAAQAEAEQEEFVL